MQCRWEKKMTPRERELELELNRERKRLLMVQMQVLEYQEKELLMQETIDTTDKTSHTDKKMNEVIM